MIPPSSRWHFDNSTVPCLRRVSFNIFKLGDTKNLEVKEKKVVLTAREENSFNLYKPSHPTGFCYNYLCPGHRGLTSVNRREPAFSQGNSN